MSRKQVDAFVIASILGATALLLLWIMIFLATPAKAQSFSCRNADTRGEQIVCENPGLRALDVQMNRAYLRALRDDARRADRIQHRQRNWLEARDACRSDGCVRRLYLDRLNELR